MRPALRKLVRDAWLARSRMAMMVLAMAVSLVAVGAILTARAVLDRELARNYLGTRPASATLVVPGGLDPATLDAVRTVPGVTDVAVRGSVVARMRTGDGRWQQLLLFVVDGSDPLRVSRFRVLSGSWPPPSGGVLLERDTLRYFDIHSGQSIVVGVPDGSPRAVTVTGSVHDPGLAPTSQETVGYGYLTPEALAPLGGGDRPVLDELKLVVDPSVAVEPTAQRVGAVLASHGKRVDHIEVPPRNRHPHQSQMDTVGTLFLAFGVMSLVLSAILVATMLGGLLAQQVRQIGVMKAVGARTGQVLRLYLLMAFTVAVAATALAVLPGLALGRYLAGVVARLLNLDLASTAVPAWVFGVQFAAGIAVPLLVALVPLVRGSRVTVREAIDDHGVSA